MTGRRYTMFSAGGGSFRAALIDRRRHPDARFGLIFTDTLYEDADAYRYLVEASAFVTGRSLAWSVSADQFPDYRVPADTPIEHYRGNTEWRAFLSDLRRRACADIPELIWLVEGRDPWEIFRDRRFLGNSQRDPCSEHAKREIAREWRSGNCWRTGELFGEPDHFAVGIGDHEADRFDDQAGGGIGPRNAADGWLYHAPLLTEPLAGEYAFFFAPLDQIGPKPPRLYDMGYSHNNCGGFCCKAGQAHYANRFRVQPDRYAYDAMMERKLVAYLGQTVSMLTDRRGGDKRPLTLDAFAQRLRRNPEREYPVLPGESGCGCMVDAL